MRKLRRTVERESREALDKVLVPHGFEPRSYQAPVLKLRGPGLRIALKWHRRSGKDVTALNWEIQYLVDHPGSLGYYILPTYSQAFKTIWVGLTASGRRMLDFFPPGSVLSKNENAMMIWLATTPPSLWHLVGSEQLDSLMGTNPSVLVFSEYSLQRPDAWDFFRPILAQNGGSAAFCFTPRGRNHAFDLFEHARHDPAWYTSRLTTDDTRKDAPGEDGGPVIAPEILQRELDEGMPRSLWEQEFKCSDLSTLTGAIYAKELAAMEAERRIGSVPHDPGYTAELAVDLGVGLNLVGLIFQRKGQGLHIIDSYQSEDGSVAALAKWIHAQPYAVEVCWLPHDAQARSTDTGTTRADLLKRLGVKVKVLPRTLSVEDDINVVRTVFPRLWVDQDKCRVALAAWSNYVWEWSERRQVYGSAPKHDQNSHWCDALRYLATSKPVTPYAERVARLRAQHGPDGPRSRTSNSPEGRPYDAWGDEIK